jgi:hypothetical protein
VHISVAGYLSTAYQVLDSDVGHAYLAGWNPDETLWLNDVAASFELESRIV